MNLALGTVQFGLSYGIANATGQTSPDEAARIVERARQAGMDTLDTAAAYGDSERVLGDIGVAGWKVVTKVPPCLEDTQDGLRWLLNHVRRSLDMLRVERLNAVLLHNASDLLKDKGAEIAAGLRALKAEGLVDKIGYSIYSPDALVNLLQIMPPDLIQAPFSILDQRLIKSGWMVRLKNAGVEVHVRSVFLQGLLLMAPNRRPAGFERWSELWTRWDALVERYGGSALAVCLGFIRQQRDISRVVIGVESLLHLEQLLAVWQDGVAVDGAALSCDDPLLVEPSNWKQS